MGQKNGKIFRWIAGGIYMVFAAYQLFINNTVVQNAGFGNSPFSWAFAAVLVLIAAALAVWLFASEKPLSAGVARGVIVATVMTIVIQLLTLTSLSDSITYTLTELLPSIAESAVWKYIFIVIQMMLLILAAFFVLSSRDATAEAEGKEEEAADKTETVVAIIEETVLVQEGAAETTAEKAEAAKAGEPEKAEGDEGKAAEKTPEKSEEKPEEKGE